MLLFSETISNWADWGKVFQSIPAFSPLIRHILSREHLPPAEIENLTPGTNSVFKVGKLVVKIFSPPESGLDGIQDMRTEIFAMDFAVSQRVSAPRVLAQGVVEDKYRFGYLVMDYVEGRQFSDAVKQMPLAEKRRAGHALARLTARMNVPCPPFNGVEAIPAALTEKRWEKYPESFLQDRLDLIQKRAYGPPVFVHGDLNGDNILLDCQGNLSIIDFADAVLAPKLYEDALAAVELFHFDAALLQGYFGEYQPDELARLCLEGLLIHPFGANVLAEHVAPPPELSSVEDLYRRIRERIG